MSTQSLPPKPDASTGSGIRDRIVELVRVRAGDLVPNPGNWRRHPERQRSALRGLLRQIGYADALLARRQREELLLIDGHLRQSLDPEQVVPVLVLDVDEQEADLLLASLDPLAALATADAPALSNLLERVEASSVAVRELLAGLARSAGLPIRPLRSDPDEVPEAPVARTKPGDLWLLGEHRLLCGDARKAEDLERLMAGERADVLWTDPPYGVEYVGKTPRALTIVGDQDEGLPELLEAAFASAATVLQPGAAIYLCHPSGPLAVLFLQTYLAQGWRLHQGLVWVKDTMVLGHADYHYRHEPIAYGYAPGGGRRGRGRGGWFAGSDQDTVFEIPRPAASRQHPTMKPVELVRRCLSNSCPPEGIVLDPFCGSGSTLIACEMQGLRGRGIELDPAYCDVIVARFEELTGIAATLENG